MVGNISTLLVSGIIIISSWSRMCDRVKQHRAKICFLIMRNIIKCLRALIVARNDRARKVQDEKGKKRTLVLSFYL